MRAHGLRNSHLLSIAPTGTISLAFADNAIASTGTSAVRIDNNQITVGLPSRGLLASYGATIISTTSLGPDTVTFSNLINKGTRFASIRFTEGANLARPLGGARLGKPARSLGDL